MSKKNKKLTYISLFSCAGVGCFAFNRQEFSCIATNELLEKRLAIQKFNNKCARLEGYIQGDLCEKTTKEKIYNEVAWWKQHEKIDSVDVVIATPPCQGMSVFNHKKKNNEINRNSLVLESIEIISHVLPKFFIFENVPAFLKTFCMLEDGSEMTIKEALNNKLGSLYSINAETINFKNYGSLSSRTRTLVIGVRNDFAKFTSPVELFPNYVTEQTLRQTIGHLKSLKEMGEIDKTDIYHSFRGYPEYMVDWIKDLKEGSSAFDNKNKSAIPYKRGKNGELIQNANKSRGKYRRLYWDNVAPVIHTRNDQLASQNTIHPCDNRVLSIRELMLVMSIPKDFQWSSLPYHELNKLSPSEKVDYLKKNEMLIRQSIGEAVPTKIFEKIAVKIKDILVYKELTDKEILHIIAEKQLTDITNLRNFVVNERKLGIASLSRIVELANNKREENAAFYTGKETLSKIFENLPEINQETINILEPSVGAGNFLPFIVAKYSHATKLNIDVVDIDSDILEVLKVLNKKRTFPHNVKIKYIHADFIEKTFNKKYDLVVGNPPFKQLSQKNSNLLAYKQITNLHSKNIISFFLEKSGMVAKNITLILPKSFLTAGEYGPIRQRISKYAVNKIIDFGKKGFRGVNIETICIFFSTENKPNKTEIESFSRNELLIQQQKYIMPKDLPNWLIYRNKAFDDVLQRKQMNAFTYFRDRYLSKKNTYEKGDIWIIQARNLNRDGSLVHIKGYDRYIKNEDLNDLACAKYKDSTNIYIVPNMTYYPRIIEKPKGTVVNGTVAILIPKENIKINKEDINFICSREFEEFYRIAMNRSVRTLNIDSASIYYYCISCKM